METILIWIVLFLLAGIFLAVKEKFSSERVTTAKNEVLDQTVEPRTEKKESKEIHGDSTENVVQRAISERQKSSRVNRSINHQITRKDQRAHELRVEQFLEQESNSRVERDLKKSATRKARVERALRKKEAQVERALRKKEAQVERQLRETEKRNADLERKAKLKLRSRRALRKKEAQVERQLQETEKRNADLERKAKLKLRSRNATRTFLSALSWNQVEHLAVDLLRYHGWYVNLTQPGVDRSIDAIATKPNEKRKAVIQVKDWKKPVSGPVVRETIGAAAMSGISEVCVITTGRFTADARNTAKEYSGQSLEKSCELWDGDHLVDLIIKMPNDDFLDMVLEGDKLKLNYKNALNEGYAAELNS